MTIHRESKGTILVTTLFLILLNGATAYFFPENDTLRKIVVVLSVILAIIVLQFFRVPKRTVISNNKHIIAPADGKVVVIEEVIESEYFKDARRQVSIFMSPINVHINFNPISGIISYFKYHPGKFLVAWHPKSSTDNERTTIVTKHADGTEVLFRQVAGALARRICWYVEVGTAVEQGKEFGFIKFGSRIDIYLPLSAKILVKLDDIPVGGETVIAELV
jgi:phosphatidylserine decarboxylase